MMSVMYLCIHLQEQTQNLLKSIQATGPLVGPGLLGAVHLGPLVWAQSFILVFFITNVM